MLSSMRKVKYMRSSFEETRRAGAKRTAEDMSGSSNACHRDEDSEAEHGPERFANTFGFVVCS